MSLSDKINNMINMIDKEDVKESVKELHEQLIIKLLMFEYSDAPEQNSEQRIREIIQTEINEIFGEDLI